MEYVLDVEYNVYWILKASDWILCFFFVRGYIQRFDIADDDRGWCQVLSGLIAR